MKIKMLENKKASDVSSLGVSMPVMLYEKGKEYEISEELFSLLKRDGLCEEVKERKSLGASPENKVLPSHDNKSKKKATEKKAK